MQKMAIEVAWRILRATPINATGLVSALLLVTNAVLVSLATLTMRRYGNQSRLYQALAVAESDVRLSGEVCVALATALTAVGSQVAPSGLAARDSHAGIVDADVQLTAAVSSTSLTNVPINLLYVGPDPDSIPLTKIVPSLARFKRTLTKAEVLGLETLVFDDQLEITMTEPEPRAAKAAAASRIRVEAAITLTCSVSAQPANAASGTCCHSDAGRSAVSWSRWRFTNCGSCSLCSSSARPAAVTE